MRLDENTESEEVNELLQQIRSILQSGDNVQSQAIKKDERHEEIRKLKKLQQSLEKDFSFTAGDIVVWKAGMRNKEYPKDGQPAVVLEILPEPIYDSAYDSKSTYFHEPLTIRLGLFDEAGSFISFLFDSKKFQRISAD